MPTKYRQQAWRWEVQELFQKLGFSDTEAKVYLALAEVGKAPATVVAKTVGIPRSSAYSTLQSLITKGIVVCEKEKEPALYLPLSPSALSKQVEVERQKLERELAEKEVVASQLEELAKPFFKSKNFSIPKIQFFEGKKDIEGMLYSNCSLWQESVANYDYTWWGYQDTHFVETYRGWLDYYWENKHPKEKIYLLSNQTSIEKKLRGRVSNRTIKPLPKENQFSSTIWALGDFVVLIMTRQQPHYAFQMKDPVFAANQRMLFKLLWSKIE